jgi:hypothetical protein
MAMTAALRASVDMRLVIVYMAALLAAFGYKLTRMRGRRPTAITTRTWEAFQQGLAGEVARLETGTRVVIAAAAEPRAYVQFVREAALLHAEAVSNRFLRSDPQRSAAQEQHLAGAGWKPPDEHNPNWWCDRPAWLAARDCQQLAALVVIALHEGLGISQPQELQYRAWNDSTRKRVDLPGLHPAEQ